MADLEKIIVVADPREAMAARLRDAPGIRTIAVGVSICGLRTQSIEMAQGVRDEIDGDPRLIAWLRDSLECRLTRDGTMNILAS